MMKTSTGGIPNQLDALAELGYTFAGHCPFTEEEYEAGDIFIEGYDPVKKTGRPSWSEIETKWTELKNSWNSEEYARKRELEYPTIEELTVAMYDEDDKAALEAKRTAVKKKWPKDNSGPVE